MPPELPKVENKSWTWRGITQHFVNAHIQVRLTHKRRFGAKMSLTRSTARLQTHATTRRKCQRTRPTLPTSTTSMVQFY